VSDAILYKLMFTEISVVAGLQVLNLLFLTLYPITRAKHQANLDRLAAATLERSHVPHSETGASSV
jgi:Na+/melibiose symporter-like transporter